MRTIKFRAWDTKNKKMLDAVPCVGYLLDDPDAPVSHHDVEERLYHYPSLPLGPTFNGRIVYEQYTGLKDKNDKEIYEGDIIHYKFDGSSYPEEAVDVMLICEYDEREGWFAFITLSENTSEYLWYEINRDCEVVGNIHENPELLKN
jgi:uncharacterized phage protein (TIGR01671 family)